MPLTLSEVAQSPRLLIFETTLPNGEEVIFRPLEPHDEMLLTKFFENLSSHTRKFYTLDSYDIRTAKEMCSAINRYDKLRFIVTKTLEEKMIALFEYSFDIPEGDKQRYKSYHITLEL